MAPSDARVEGNTKNGIAGPQPLAPWFEACSTQLQAIWQCGRGWRCRSDSKGRHRRQADRLELWFPPGHPAWWWWGTCFFHLQPIQAEVGAFLPQGCPYLVSGLQSSSHSPHPPKASFPTRPPSHLPPQSCQSLAEPQVRAFDLALGPEGRTACLTWAGFFGIPAGWSHQ